ncbi:MAG TPA: tRNA 2-thiouridine(34) synthase MnmA [Candidatus Hypogeohydataceae bacterium YC40]
MKERVVVAMSGGVDSSLAAYLLKESGYEAVGLFMRMGNPYGLSIGQRTRTCCSLEDAEDARRVAEQLGIPFYVLDFKSDFEGLIDYFCQEYSRGRTPNPCILCNQKLKFAKLLQMALKIGASRFATGHYARVESPKVGHGRYILKKGLDPKKDQSYVLFCLSQTQLSHSLFPLGEMTKEEVRKKARELGLKTRNKPDSQEVCFVSEEGYSKLIKERKGETKAGLVKDTHNRILGRHPGIEFFTIGQRKGLGLALGIPYYVVAINPEEGTVIVGTKEELLEKEFFVSRTNWVAIEGLEEERQVEVKIRYTHPAVPATLYTEGEDRVRVIFSEQQRAITPGQAAVFYEGDIVLGGGWIEGAVTKESFLSARPGYTTKADGG